MESKKKAKSAGENGGPLTLKLDARSYAVSWSATRSTRLTHYSIQGDTKNLHRAPKFQISSTPTQRGLLPLVVSASFVLTASSKVDQKYFNSLRSFPRQTRRTPDTKTRTGTTSIRKSLSHQLTHRSLILGLPCYALGGPANIIGSVRVSFMDG